MKQDKSLSSTWPIVLALSLAGTVAIPMAVWSRPGTVHEIRLVVRDMTFYQEGENSPNPTLRVKRGEQVRVVLRNEDDGMSHGMSIDAWRVRLPQVRGRGERSVTFHVPGEPGSSTYACNPHSEMMRGSIVVE